MSRPLMIGGEEMTPQHARELVREQREHLRCLYDHSRPNPLRDTLASVIEKAAGGDEKARKTLSDIGAPWPVEGIRGAAGNPG